MQPRELCAPYKLIQQYLIESEEPLSIHDLAAKLGISHRNTQQYIRLLRERGIVRIAKYFQRTNTVGGCPTPLYGLGSRDCKRPTPLTPKQCAAKSRDRHRAKINAGKRAARAKASGRTIQPMQQVLKLLGLL